MAKSRTDTQPKSDEFSKIFDVYHAKIDEITRRTKRSLQYVDAPPDNTVDNDDEPPEEIINEGQPEATYCPVEVERQPDKEVANIVKEAKQKAKQIIHEAEERIKKEAKKKTQSKVDQIIGKARKESEDIIARARQAAEKEGNEIVAASKHEAKQLIKYISEKYREETQAQSSQVIAEARKKAEEMLAGVIASSTQINQLVSEIVHRANNTVHELENRLQIEISELARAITEAQKKLEQVGTVTAEEKELRAAPSKKKGETDKNTVLFVRFTGEKSRGNNGDNPLFSGQMEMKAVSSFEYKQIKNIKNHLAHTPGIRYVQEYASEKEMSVFFEVKEPLPLLDIFGNLPSVDKVITEADGISLILKKHV